MALLHEFIYNTALVAVILIIYSLVFYNHGIYKHRYQTSVMVIMGLFSGLLSSIIFYFNLSSPYPMLIPAIMFFLLFVTANQFRNLLSSLCHFFVISVVNYLYFEPNPYEFLLTVLLLCLLFLIHFLLRKADRVCFVFQLVATAIISTIHLGMHEVSVSFHLLNLFALVGLSLFHFIVNYMTRLAYHRYYLNYKYARRDYLTNLYNRRKLEIDIQHLEQEPAGKISLAFLDVDDFKGINDTYGHHCGDLVLKELANAIQNVPVVGANAYRISGEEFCIIFKDVAHEVVNKVMIDLQSQISSKPITFGQYPPFQVTMSIGLIHCSLDQPPIRQLMELADHLMYKAKSNGKNKLEIQYIA